MPKQKTSRCDHRPVSFRKRTPSSERRDAHVDRIVIDTAASLFLIIAGKKPQAFAHCGLRLRKLIVYEIYPAPVRVVKNTSGPDVNRKAVFRCRNKSFVAEDRQGIRARCAAVAARRRRGDRLAALLLRCMSQQLALFGPA
jgi:hypothetical protein